MSVESRFVSESLEALLLSIAEGVREAQDALNTTPPVDTFGRPTTTFHLPYLDFKVKANMETASKSTGGGRLFLKIRKGPQSSSSRDITSTLSGRLVAIPPGEGLPTPFLTITSKRQSARSHLITLNALNSAGEILAGQTIELNINLEASQQLSELEGINLTTLRPATKLSEVILVTDTEGVAETVFTIDPRVPAKAILVLTAELGTEIVNLSVPAGGGA